VNARVLISLVALVAAVAVGLGVAALVAWPHSDLAPDGDALARVTLPRLGGSVTAAEVHTAAGTKVPVVVRQGRLWPVGTLPAGERLRIALTVRRPGYAGWLVGRSETRRFTITTPTAHLRGRWLQVKAGTPVEVAFDQPVRLVWLGPGQPVRRLAQARSVFPVGKVAAGSHAVGSVEVAAAARSWERLSSPERVTWFPAQPYPQVLVSPKPGVALSPSGQLRLTFSSPLREVLGTRKPTVSPVTPGSWRQADDHTLVFRPGGLGFPLDSTATVGLPRSVHVAGQPGATLTSQLQWEVPRGSTTRMEQLLAQLGYLPLDWQPDADPVPATMRDQLAAAVDPPPGRFSWRYPNTPPELTSLWKEGDWNEIVRGAVMMFQDDHDLAVDAIPGPNFWKALLSDAVAGTRRDAGYSYVFVHRMLPQSLNLWHNGAVILSSPGNTGVPAAPTQLGTFPVFEHIPIGTMAGTNPDGSHYNDPGIRWISYFNHGEAIHAFNRNSFGTPQSLGCVELPLDAAAKVWPYTPIGTLVTVED
jgi:hypothetical protein